jgi:hypothetical protein
MAGFFADFGRPIRLPLFFLLERHFYRPICATELVAGSYKMKIASKKQKDANGRRAVAMSDCGSGSSSIYISAEKPYHLTYDNKEAKNEKFGSFYLCSGGKKGDWFSYGDGLFYRSADEKTPEECGEVTFYPEW